METLQDDSCTDLDLFLHFKSMNLNYKNVYLSGAIQYNILIGFTKLIV